jgi:gliding motility-associated-like protein
LISRHSNSGIFLLLLLLISAKLEAQTCEGSLGDPVEKVDFGRGSNQYGPAFSSTNYNHVTISPEDGSYTIANSTAGMNPGWFLVSNHTPGDNNGYMMIVNANDAPGKIFYESNAPINLCPNTTYEFAAWIINILRSPGGKMPNITFSILSLNDELLAPPYNTGDIPNANPTWKQYGFTFRTSSAGQVKIKMVNNGPGGGGNDLALDDITFRACGPQIIGGIDNTPDLAKGVCEGANAEIKLTATVIGPATLKYQWQRNIGNGWIDVPGETGSSMTARFGGEPVGKYEYRLAVAEPGNFNSPICRTSSPVMTVNVVPYPKPQALNNGPVCLGDPIVLDVADVADSYEWRDPMGAIIGTSKSVVVSRSATSAMAGTYTVSVTTGGCNEGTSTLVSVIAPPEPSVANPAPEICEGGSVELSASGGISYSWSPASGLSATDVENPVASPLVTTLYTVKVSNGSCFRTAQVNVIVHKSPKADAGPDKKVLLGYEVKLSGKALGDGIDYFWTPAVEIDDPKSLNPVVSPTRSTTYTLHVISSLGCITATDEVFVKVYDKLIVPSAFSPNGDQVNDTWNITALDAFETAHVRVVNRYGETVYENTGYLNAWDGKYKNNDLPPGVYYYIVKLRSDVKPVSGSVTLLR